MNRKWVINASPLIGLGKIGKIDWLEQLGMELVVPKGVYNELLAGSITDPARQWIELKGSSFIRESPTIPENIREMELGLGESEVIAWAALHPDYEAILDDSRARQDAQSLGVSVHGTLHILALAKHHDLISEVKPHLERLTREGFHISDHLKENFLRKMKE